jgi:DNA polymerase
MKHDESQLDPVIVARNIAAVRSQITSCTACKLVDCSTQRVPFRGSPLGKAAHISIIGEAPGPKEDKAGQPFIGPSGKLLDQLMGEVFGFTSHDCMVYNAASCWPNRDGKTVRPTDIDRQALQKCRPNLLSQIALADSPFLLLLGNSALEAFRPGIAIGQIHGRPMMWNGRMLFPTYHPAAALRATGIQRAIRIDLSKLATYIDDPSREWPEDCLCGNVEIERADDFGLYWCAKCWPNSPEQRVLRK